MARHKVLSGLIGLRSGEISRSKWGHRTLKWADRPSRWGHRHPKWADRALKWADRDRRWADRCGVEKRGQ